MIAVTGASGHLGSRLIEIIPDAVPIRRTFPKHRVNGIIHCAAPSFKDDEKVHEFYGFNEELRKYIDTYDVTHIVNIGSWWQYALGNCQQLSYTRLKKYQQHLFPDAVHLIPYSIYGDTVRDGRGFIPQLIAHLNRETQLKGLSTEPRDFIHVDDVAQAAIMGLVEKPGVYLAGTYAPVSPADIAHYYGITGLPPYREYPNALPVYDYNPLPGWEPETNLITFINEKANL